MTLNEWSDEQVEFMEAIGGSASGNFVYENLRKPPLDASLEERTDFTR